MAEILILAFNTSNSDEAKDVFAYKLGHVIDVKPDGHAWGKSECLPKFYLVKLPKVSVENVQKFLDAKMDLVTGTKQIAIRRYKLDVANLPTAIKTALERDGVITINKVSDFEGYLING